MSFILFLSGFLTVYGLVHTYFYLRLRAALSFSTPFQALAIVLLIFLLLAPILTHVAARHESYRLALLLAHVGYLWMGSLFLFLCAHLLIDLYGGMIRFSAIFFSPISSKWSPGNATAFLLAASISLGIMVYGWHEARDIRVERRVIETDKLPSEANPLRIVQISDTHFSMTNGVGLARRIVEKVRALQPHILVSTGDLTDRGLGERQGVEAIFRELQVPYGKYAVTGNHEFYAGIEEAARFTQRAGFRLLRNEGLEVGDLVNIVGVDDPTSKRLGQNDHVTEYEILEKFSNGKLTILLKHRPLIEEKSRGKFDVQLSGHLHKGQIFPFSLLISLLFPYRDGLFQLQHAHLHVSRGTGTWGPPVRFLAPPEITLIEFRRGD